MSLLKQLGSVMSDGFGTVEEVGAGDVSGFMDSGSYSLNALVSGSIYGGFPTNKITGFVGEKSTGKTFFIVRGIKGFQEQYQNGEVIIMDTEFAITSEQLKAQGCDVSRIAWEPVATVEEFRTKVMQVLGIYRESIKDHLKKHKKAPPPQLMFVLDSIGGLSTNKEVEDIKEGNDKRDMTKQQLLKGAFRVITIECGKLNVPILVTGHTYAAIGAYVPTQVVAGGTGMQYAASTILLTSKAYEKEGTVATGSIIRFVTEKSRLTRERQKVESLLRYDGGIDRFYGLLPMAEAAGIFKKVGNKYELPDGRKAFESQILKDPEKFYTKEILDRVDEYCQRRFKYTSGAVNEDEDGVVDPVESEEATISD